MSRCQLYGGGALWLVMVLHGTTGGAAADEVYRLHTFQRVPLTEVYFSEGASFGDFNRDGKNDIVSGPYWYEGPDFSRKHAFYPPTPFPKERGYADNFFAFVGDFNDDGWPDIFNIGFPGKPAHWYENPRGKTGHWKRHVAFPSVDNESPTLGDLTGDGKAELIFHTGGRLGFAAPDREDPTAPWTFHPISPPGNWKRFTHGFGFGDVNGDGRRDILELNGWWEQPASLEGDPLWKHHAFRFGQAPAQIHTYDVDGDGDSDVISGLHAHGYGLSWFEQVRGEGGAIDFREHRIMGEEPSDNPYGVKFSQLHAVNVVDVDGDGLRDILTGKCFWAHGPRGDPEPNAPAVIYWFRLVRDGGRVHWIPHRIDDNSGVGRQVMAGDISGNGLVDVVIGNKKGTILFLHETRKVGKEEWEKARPRLRSEAPSR